MPPTRARRVARAGDEEASEPVVRGVRGGRPVHAGRRGRDADPRGDSGHRARSARRPGRAARSAVGGGRRRRVPDRGRRRVPHRQLQRRRARTRRRPGRRSRLGTSASTGRRTGSGSSRFRPCCARSWASRSRSRRPVSWEAAGSSPGRRTADAPTFVPASTRDALPAGALDDPQRVRLGRLEAFRHTNLVPEGFNGTLTLYTVPQAGNVDPARLLPQHERARVDPQAVRGDRRHARDRGCDRVSARANDRPTRRR